MIVCICRAVSDRTIQQTIAEGASTVDDLGERCGAGTGCGACVPTLCTMLRGRAGGGAGATDCVPRASSVPSGTHGGA